MTSTLAIVIAALCLVESGNNPSIRDGDNGRAVGVLQMWPCSVSEANRLVGRQVWTLADRRDPAKSKAMARVILASHYRRGVRNPVELASRWRNPQGNAPEWYLEKIRRASKCAGWHQ